MATEAVVAATMVVWAESMTAVATAIIQTGGDHNSAVAGKAAVVTAMWVVERANAEGQMRRQVEHR